MEWHSGLNWTENRGSAIFETMKISKKQINFLLIMCSAFLLGCGSATIPELSDEASLQIIEYATGLMLKYDTAYSSRLLSDKEMEEKEAEEAKERERENAYKEAAKKYQEIKENADKEKANSKSSASSASAPVEQQLSDIGGFYGIEGVSVSYTGYELTASYPNSGEDLLMAMDASPDKQLLILKFDVANISDENVNFDMFYRNPKFSISIDGEKSINHQSTLLLDDMAAYVGEISAGDTVPMVLIFEVPKDLSEIGNVTLSARNSDGKGSITLQ